MAPSPQCPSQTHHRPSTCAKNAPRPQDHAYPPRAAVAAPWCQMSVTTVSVEMRSLYTVLTTVIYTYKLYSRLCV